MISGASIVSMLITFLVTGIFPIILMLVCAIIWRKKGFLPAWFLGAAGFFVMQIIIRLPMVSLISALPGFAVFVEKFYIVYVFVLALTAALFEVVARFGVAKILQKNMNPEKGLATGLGHGGIEAMVLIGMTYVNNLIISVLINTGGFKDIMLQVVKVGPQDAVQQLMEMQRVLITTSPVLYLLAGYERILTMIFHAAMSLLICYFVYKKKAIIGILLVTIAHFAVDFTAPLLQGLATPYLGNLISQTTSYALVYAFLTVVAFVSFVIILLIMIIWKKEEKKRIAADEQTA